MISQLDGFGVSKSEEYGIVKVQPVGSNSARGVNMDLLGRSLSRHLLWRTPCLRLIIRPIRGDESGPIAEQCSSMVQILLNVGEKG